MPFTNQIEPLFFPKSSPFSSSPPLCSPFPHLIRVPRCPRFRTTSCVQPYSVTLFNLRYRGWGSEMGLEVETTVVLLTLVYSGSHARGSTGLTSALEHGRKWSHGLTSSHVQTGQGLDGTPTLFQRRRKRLSKRVSKPRRTPWKRLDCFGC